MTFQNIFNVGFNKHNGPKINILIHTGKKYWLKNVFLSQYLFIAISKYREQKCLVCNGPYARRNIFIKSLCSNNNVPTSAKVSSI